MSSYLTVLVKSYDLGGLYAFFERIRRSRRQIDFILSFSE